MKWMSLMLPAIAVSLFASDALPTQGNDQTGRWELRVAESRYVNREKPINETRIIETQGKGAKVSVEGTAGGGSSMAYAYTTDYDGKEDRVSGKGQPFSADTVAIKRVDANTTSIVEKKDGRVVATGTNVVSNNGEVMTITLKSPDNKSGIVMVWDR